MYRYLLYYSCAWVLCLVCILCCFDETITYLHLFLSRLTFFNLQHPTSDLRPLISDIVIEQVLFSKSLFLFYYRI